MQITQQQKRDFDEKGYIILKNVVDLDKINKVVKSFEEYVALLAKDCEISEKDYREVVSQIRDLWKFNPIYKELLFHSELASIAAEFMGKKAARLLHDHVISKPQNHSNEIPWHQDYPYWPTDHPGGLSCWLALDNVDENAGPLEIIPYSHSEGETEPVDFIRNPRKDFETHPKRMKLPVSKGDVVVLHCLTWHKTGKNTSSPNRRAYISLWVPPESHYAPKHASWHPVNDHITVQEGELLNEDWFPVIGKIDRKELQQSSFLPLRYNGPENANGELSMFSASKMVKNRLEELISKYQLLEAEQAQNLFQYLLQNQNRKKFLQKLKKHELIDDLETADKCLKELSINFIAYGKHQARNVYNEPYLQFKDIFFREESKI